MKGIAALNDWIAIAGSIPMLVDLVPKGIIHSVVSGSAQTWFIIYFYYFAVFTITIVKVVRE
jgi:hypothetical protein